MSRKSFLIYLSALLLLLFSSCGGQNSQQQGGGEASQQVVDDFSFPVEVLYAKGFVVENHPDYKVLRILNTSESEVSDTYILYPKGAEQPEYPGEGAAKYIPIPTDRVITTSSVQVGAFPILDGEEAIIGSTSFQYLTNEKVRARIDEGLITEVGQGMSNNFELIVSLEPEILLLDYIDSPEEVAKFKASGIPLLLFNSWRDQSLLGRAEWLKVIGLLLGNNEKADAYFRKVVEDYEAAKNLITDGEEWIPIMYGQDYKGVWYVPGALSYAANMFGDAKLSFGFVPNQSDSAPRNFEEIFSANRHAIYWFASLYRDLETIEEFASQNEHYQYFDAVKKGRVISDRKRVNDFGGNDYWESGPYRPDLLLKDLIKVTRPELLPDYETVYWKELVRVE